MSQKRVSAKFKLLTLALSLLFALLVSEVTLRAFNYRPGTMDPDMFVKNDNPLLPFKLRPSYQGNCAGKDVKIVSIDGTRNAVQAIVDGTINAVIESNPRFGPLAFKTAGDFYGGTAIPANVIISDREYDSTNAQSSLDSAY